MKRKVVIIKFVPEKTTSGQSSRKRVHKEVSVRRLNNQFFVCLGRHNILQICKNLKIATIPLEGYWDYNYDICYGFLVIKIVDVECLILSPDPPEHLWKRIILQYSSDGKLQVIKHTDKKAMNYFIDPETNEIRVYSEHSIEIISKSNIHEFMLEYFGLKNFFWTIPLEERRKLYPHVMM
jgi:hypothetical protein